MLSHVEIEIMWTNWNWSSLQYGTVYNILLEGKDGRTEGQRTPTSCDDRGSIDGYEMTFSPTRSLWKFLQLFHLEWVLILTSFYSFYNSPVLVLREGYIRFMIVFCILISCARHKILFERWNLHILRKTINSSDPFGHKIKSFIRVKVKGV